MNIPFLKKNFEETGSYYDVYRPFRWYKRLWVYLYLAYECKSFDFTLMR